MKILSISLLFLTCAVVINGHLQARLPKKHATRVALASTLKEQLDAAKSTRHANKKKSDCLDIFKICEVPAVISHPGKWAVCKNLVYSGSGAAIIIAADNVNSGF